MISIISSKDLYNTKQRPPMEQANGKVTSPTHVRYMSGICPVYVRYMSGRKADIYRTSAELIADNNRRKIGAPREQLYR